MARLVVSRVPGAGCVLELEGRRLKTGDPIWVPELAPRSLVAVGFEAAVFLGANCFERVLRVRLADGSIRRVAFDVGLRRRELGSAHVA